MALVPLPPEFSPRTVPELLADRAATHPDRYGFVAKFADGQYRPVSYAEWDALSTRVAVALRDRFGVQKGAKVAWLLGNANGGEALILYHAVLKLGAVNVPINVRLVPPEIRYILDHCEAQVCLFASALYDTVAAAAETLPVRPSLIAVGDARSGVVNFSDLVAGRDVPLAPVPLVAEDDADLLYTSGTTGRPKGVLHTHGSSVATGIAIADVFCLSSSDVLQSPFPIFTGAGSHFNGLSILWAGGTNVLDDYETESTLRLMAQYRTSVYVAVPSIYQFILESPVRHTVDLSAMRVFDYGGAAMAPSIIRDLREAFPRTGLMQTYGLTEGGPLGIYLPAEYALVKLGSVGNRGAARFVQFRVVDERGEDVGPGGTGEFLLRGPTVMKEYYKDPAATAAALAGGWLHTGDIVRIDRDGFVYHVDRKKDIVIRGGYNVSSVEVEAALMEHPAVLEAAIVAKPHPKLGEDIKAIVVFRAGQSATPAELTAFCRERLADFKLPRDIEVRAELPRNAAGKVMKRLLRDEATASVDDKA